MFHPPLLPVGHAKKSISPEWAIVPLQSIEKPGVGAAPTSHCHCVVGGVSKHPLPCPSVKPEESMSMEQCQLAEVELTPSAIDTVLAKRQAALTDSVLSVRELADWSTWTSVGSDAEATVKGVSTRVGSHGSESEVYQEPSRGTRLSRATSAWELAARAKMAIIDFIVSSACVVAGSETIVSLSDPVTVRM